MLFCLIRLCSGVWRGNSFHQEKGRQDSLVGLCIDPVTNDTGFVQCAEFCGGSVIENGAILSAGHCCDGNLTIIFYGSNSFSDALIHRKVAVVTETEIYGAAGPGGG